MASFCTNCSLHMFGEEVIPDIDVQSIYNTLKPGFYQQTDICEGCGLIAVVNVKRSPGVVFATFLPKRKDKEQYTKPYIFKRYEDIP